MMTFRKKVGQISLFCHQVTHLSFQYWDIETLRRENYSQ